MPIRKATYRDLLPSSRIYAAAFRDEDLFGRCLHPYRDQYPNDMYLFFLRGMRTAFHSGPDYHFLVSYLRLPNGEEKITGWAQWIRKRRVTPPPTYFSICVQRIVAAYNYIETLLYPDRALEPSRLSMMPHLGRLYQCFFVGDRAESWCLATLGVDPSVQKTGHGRELVSWGMNRAREEGVCVSVVSSAGNERFYRNCGFDVNVGRVGDIEDPVNPFKDVAGGAIMFKDAEPLKEI